MSWVANWKATKNVKFATYTKLGHKLLGFALIFLSNIEVATGIYCYRTPIRKLIFVHLTVLILLTAVCEYVFNVNCEYHGRGVLKKRNLPKYSNAEFDSLIKSGKKLVLFNNYIIDVSTFAVWHPGTAYAINECIGMDIGKYFFGTTHDVRDVPRYSHSSFAAKILEKLAIGKLVHEDQDHRNLRALSTVKVSSYAVDKVREVCPDVIRVTMRIPKYRGKISRNHSADSLKNLGMSYCVTSVYDPKTRYYSICDSMREDVYGRYCDIFNSTAEDTPISFRDLKVQDFIDDSLEFVIKRCALSDSSLSKQLIDAEKFHRFYAYGPIGKPFDFKPENTEGINMIFCAGTGILPFMDLFAYLGRKMMKKSGYYQDEEFDEISDKAYFIIYAYFPTRKDAIGIELVEAVQKIYKKHFMGDQFYFNLILTQEGGEKFNDDELMELIQDYSTANQGINRLQVCGPPSMNLQFQRLAPKIMEEGSLIKSRFNIL